MALISRLPGGGSSKGKLNVFTQELAPTTFNGIWIQTNQKHRKVVTDTKWFIGGEYDVSSEYVQNLASVIYTAAEANGHSNWKGTTGFFLYNNDLYVTIIYVTSTTGFKTNLYKIICEDELNVSLELITSFSGFNYNMIQFGKYIFWAGVVTGNGSTSETAYVYDFETNTTKQLGNLQFIYNPVVYKNTMFGISNGVLYKINIDLDNPTSVSVTSLLTGLPEYAPLCVYNGSMYTANLGSSVTETSRTNTTLTLCQIVTDDELSTFELVEMPCNSAVTDEEGTTKSYADQRGCMFISQNGLLYMAGGYYTGNRYVIRNIEDGSLVQYGEDIADIVCVADGAAHNPDSGGMGLRLIETIEGIIGLVGKHGVLKYNHGLKQYDEGTVIVSKNNPTKGEYYTEFIGYEQIEDFNNGTHCFKTGFNDVLYFHNGDLDDKLPTYYGDGTQWIKFKN